jgi:aerobic-type carbon monoxide dehydrogenase small subunit (CoxS/CutS family)
VTAKIGVSFSVNGIATSVQVEPRTTLADCLRHDLRLTGTHVGCEHGVCGACTIIVDNDAVRSCLMLAVQADGSTLSTVEGLGSLDSLSVLQQSFQDNHALQCGFCTPGILMTAHALLKAEPQVSTERITEILSGNICRCTGYIPIVKAIVQARDMLAGTPQGRRSDKP